MRVVFYFKIVDPAIPDPILELTLEGEWPISYPTT
jgi:hypothetical protein